MTMGPLDLPIDAQALSLPYEITGPLDVDELAFTPDGIAYLEVNTASHLGRWLLGFSTPGDRPRRVLEARTTGPGTSEQAYATAGLALAAEGDRHGLVLAAAANRNGERPADERATMLYAVFAVARRRPPLVSDETIAEVAALEERDRVAGGPPWEVPDHPDHDLPGGWHRGLGTLA